MVVGNWVVIDVDTDELRAAFAEAKARSRLLLDPEAYRAATAKQAEQRHGDVVVQRQAPPVVVERRTYDGIGWSPPPLMPAEFVEILPPKPKSKPLSEAEIEALVESRVERALRKHRVLTAKAIAPILIELRQQLRTEIGEAQTAPARNFSISTTTATSRTPSCTTRSCAPSIILSTRKSWGQSERVTGQSGSPGRRLSEPRASSICPRCRCGVLAVPDDPKSNALALDLMQRATLAQLRDDATDLAGLVREILRPLPVLPSDPVEREVVLTILLLQSKERERHVLTLIAGGDVRC